MQRISPEDLKVDIKCTKCKQDYNPKFITEDGICDYCDAENLDNKDIKNGVKFPEFRKKTAGRNVPRSTIRTNSRKKHRTSTF